jgi:hypothetical protein
MRPTIIAISAKLITLISFALYVMGIGNFIYGCDQLMDNRTPYIVLLMVLASVIFGFLNMRYVKSTVEPLYAFHLSNHWRKENLIFRTLREEDDPVPLLSTLRVLSVIVTVEGLLLALTSLYYGAYFLFIYFSEDNLPLGLVTIFILGIIIGSFFLCYSYWVWKWMNFITKYKPE